MNVPKPTCVMHPGRPAAAGESKSNFTSLSKCWKALDTESSQDAWGNWVSALGLSYAHIRSFTWGAWSDGPDGGAFGLVAGDGRAKPLLATLKARRGQCTG